MVDAVETDVRTAVILPSSYNVIYSEKYIVEFRILYGWCRDVVSVSSSRSRVRGLFS